VLVESLYNSMRTGAAPIIGVEEGIQSALVCFAIDEAMDAGKVVDLNPLWALVKA
jgi:hypothetical protein